MNYHRRRFIKNLTGLAATMVLGATGTKLSAMNITEMSSWTNDTASIPMPIQVVIDDVGWWSGKDGSLQQEPFRTGINRHHTMADYEAIIELGCTLGIRPQAAMVLCEWDRENILRELPESTWMGEKWDNSKWVGTRLDEAADLILNNQDHFEFTLHGIGHEHWSGGKLTRAEWATGDGTMRPVSQVNRHLDYYEKIMQQNKLGSLPTSFVPTAFNHGFGLTGKHTQSLAELLNKRGISYINTPYYKMQNADKVANGVFGLDAGVLTIDRGNDLLNWNVIGGHPKGELQGPTCGMHWPNLLHENPERNSEIVDGWVAFLEPYNEGIETILAKDSLHFQKQLVHHVSTRLSLTGKQIEIDFSETNKLGTDKGMDDLTIKFMSLEEKVFHSEDIHIVSQEVSGERDTRMYTLLLQRKDKNDKALIHYQSTP
jgi:hypothetical protein